jgi:hypothetical protein
MKSYLKFAVAMLASFSLLSVNALPKDKKDDPEEIRNRDVGKGVNFYSIEKEIALGKQMAQEVERQSKIITDPIIAEYVNRVGQNLVRNSDAKVQERNCTDWDDRCEYCCALQHGWIWCPAGCQRSNTARIPQILPVDGTRGGLPGFTVPL